MSTAPEQKQIGGNRRERRVGLLRKIFKRVSSLRKGEDQWCARWDIPARGWLASCVSVLASQHILPLPPACGDTLILLNAIPWWAPHIPPTRVTRRTCSEHLTLRQILHERLRSKLGIRTISTYIYDLTPCPSLYVRLYVHQMIATRLTHSTAPN